MSDFMLPALPPLSDDWTAPTGWKRVRVWLPRIALCDTESGLHRRILWPGMRRQRMSRRRGQLIYRR
jgi:hypothetical protein